MVVSTGVVARKYLDVSAGTPISVDIPCYEAGDVYVYYGAASLLAVQGSDYTVTLAGDFETFTVTPTAALLDKINALIAQDEDEVNYITVRRNLDYETDATPAGVRYTPYTSREFDRNAMRDAQLHEQWQRALSLPEGEVGGGTPVQVTARVGQFLKRTVSGIVGVDPTDADAVLPSSYVYPQQYGARADGATSDANAIQAALNNGTVVILDGQYFVSASDMDALPWNGLAASAGTYVFMTAGSAIILENGETYNHVLIASQNAENVTFDGVVIEGNGAFANGIALSGIGGTPNNNVRAINCVVKNIKSELVVRSVAEGGLYQREGGAAFIMELDGYGGLDGCSAIGCSFALRYAPHATERCYYTVNGFHAEDCEAVLNTTPSNFDNRDYAQDATYNKLMPTGLSINGLTFKNCGGSTDARSQLSFIWRDSSAETGGRASGNYHPWAGLRRNSAGTYQGLNWEPVEFNAADTEWSGAATYNDGDRVKVTNDGSLGGVFLFGRVGGVQINGVRGWNDSYSGTYPVVGALFRGIMRGVMISDVHVDVACKSLFHSGTTPSSTWDLQPFMISQHVYANNVFNLGSQDYIAKSDMPWNGTWHTSFSQTRTVDFEKAVGHFHLLDIKVRGINNWVDASLHTDAPSETTSFDDFTSLEVLEVSSGAHRRGRFSDFASRLSNATDWGLREVGGNDRYINHTDKSVAVREYLNNATDYRLEMQQNDSQMRFGAKQGPTLKYMLWNPALGGLLCGTSGTNDLGRTVNAWRSLYLTTAIYVGNDNVVGARKTGWGAPTGATDRGAFDPSTITLEELAQRVAALIVDLRTHGLIGT
jgi:hypothetical protein